MKALFAALALSVSATAFAQAVPDPTWTLSPVTGGKDKVVVDTSTTLRQLAQWTAQRFRRQSPASDWCVP